MNIPPEIQLQIFQHLEKHDVKRCLTVCKNWNAIAIRCYYQDLTITNHNVETLKANLDNKQYIKHYRWIKTLILLLPETGDYNIIEDEKQFLKFITYLPSLKKIKLGLLVSIKRYLEYLVGANSQEHLTQIEEIYVENPFMFSHTDKYYDVYFNFRASLATI